MDTPVPAPAGERDDPEHVRLDDTPVKGVAACPGDNATDMKDDQGAQRPSEGAKVVGRAATLDVDGPTGSLDANGTVAW